MALVVNPASPLPLYHQIREQLRSQIVDGRLHPGDALPGEAQICSETGVSRMTARQALGLLAQEGLVVRLRGRGTFVAALKDVLPDVHGLGLSYTGIMERAGRSAGARVRSQAVVPAPDEIASRLRLSPGALVVCIVRLRSASGEPMSLETTFYSQARFPDLVNADLTDVSLHQFLQDRYGIVPALAEDTVEISVAGPYEAAELGIHEGGPIARVTTIAWLGDGTPLAYTQTIHRGDRFRASIRRGRASLEAPGR